MPNHPESIDMVFPQNVGSHVLLVQSDGRWVNISSRGSGQLKIRCWIYCCDIKVNYNVIISFVLTFVLGQRFVTIITFIWSIWERTCEFTASTISK